ncbi:putative tyrosinase [Caballeronia hypogeia]|uniref:Tyrosinase n=1 Tax=Caballeronia hypogeia TaxID=1777140 RepID=A0A158C0S9_9BURK|nr:tyrosinase family protein [Caballeronia hypogeia]SAK75871.1 putative tyrosinase [Caballeronia hypogeia]
MVTTSISRRAFVQGTTSALALASLPRISLAATPIIRLEWQVFKTTSHYAPYLNALRTMQATPGSTSSNAWQYWANIHANYCPHDKAYFLAWHRGYLYYLEQRLRTISGDTTLMLPYWDYYTYPTIPSEFTDTASGNPLYTSRVNTNAYQALSMTPFGTGVTNYQIGLNNAFETNLETAPHDPVHDIIGGYMANISTAALDPLFYLHHANLDRLWNAWTRRSTSKMPAATNSYWNGTFTYASNLSMARSLTRTVAGFPNPYDYANDNMPTGLPPQAQQGRIIRVQAPGLALRARPALGTFKTTGPGSVSSTRNSLGGLTGIPLGNNSVSAAIGLQTAGLNSLRDVLATSPGGQPATPSQGVGQAKHFQYVKLTFDGLSTSTAGDAGGYFYNIYLNLPASGDVDSVGDAHFVGTIGPFDISVARQHTNGSKDFDVTYLLAQLGLPNMNQMVVSFERVNGPNYAQGTVVSVNELRLELATDAP